MITELKSFYERLVDGRRNDEDKYKIKHSHDQHELLSDNVKIIKKLIKSEDPSWKQDKEFLEDLLYKKDNGIASAGQSMLSKEQFHSFIENDNFMSSLGELILNPIGITLQRFNKTWKEQKGSNNLIRILRTAAACTLEVSTTVDIQKFNPAFDWLFKKGMILEYLPDDSHYSRSPTMVQKKYFSNETN